jgi:hypothetical protein
MSHSLSKSLALTALLFTATFDICIPLPRHIVLSVEGPTTAAYCSSGTILIRRRALTTKRMFTAAWFDLPARSNYCSIKQVRTRSYSLEEYDWPRRNTYVRAVHEACALVAHCLVSVVKTLLPISRHTVLICILTPIFGPYWTSSGLILVALRPASLPSLRTMHFGR